MYHCGAGKCGLLGVVTDKAVPAMEIYIQQQVGLSACNALCLDYKEKFTSDLGGARNRFAPVLVRFTGKKKVERMRSARTLDRRVQ